MKYATARISLVCAVLGTLATSATAQPGSSKKAATKPPVVAVSPEVIKARELFASGASLVKEAQWAEALGAFQESSRLHPHPITTYNIGACERALGRYTAAQAMLGRAIAGEPGSGDQLPESFRTEAEAYLAEMERILVHVDLKIAPADAAVAVDGRPLEVADRADGKRLLVAGRRPAGRGEVLPAAQVELVLDPGTHLLTLSRKGFSDQVVTKTFRPAAHEALELNLDKLPAKLRVSSNEARSLVRIDRRDVGYAPADVERPAGAYKVSVEKPGFVTYDTTVKVNPGEAADIKATLAHTPITQKWWFWTAAGVLVTGAVAGTYFATRSQPAPERPALDGGGLGWTLQVP